MTPTTVTKKYKDLAVGDRFLDEPAETYVVVMEAPRPSVMGRVQFHAIDKGGEKLFAVQAEWDVEVEV